MSLRAARALTAGALTLMLSAAGLTTVSVSPASAASPTGAWGAPTMTWDFENNILPDLQWAPRDPQPESRWCSPSVAANSVVAAGSFQATVKKVSTSNPLYAQTVASAKAKQKLKRDAAIAAANKKKGKAKTKALKAAKKLKVNGCPKGVFTNAQVSADFSGLAMHTGKVAAMVKLPWGQGLHSSIWLQSYESGVGGPEIDFIESFGYGMGITSGIRTPSKKGLVSNGGYILNTGKTAYTKKRSWWDAYHEFAVEWTNKQFKFYVDGKLVRTIKKTTSWKYTYFPIMSVLTSDWELPLLTKPNKKRAKSVKKVDWSSGSTTMQVKWLKVWSNK